MQAHIAMRDRVFRRTHAPRGPWLGIILLLLVAVTVRLIDLDRLPVTDELYTTLAARGWMHDGEPRIAEGLYTRAQLYTLLLAGWLGAFGDDVVGARSLSLIAGGLLVVAVFVWVRLVADNLAAWIAGLFVALDPLSVQISQYVRFYAMHALVFWLATIAAYALVAGQVPQRAKVWVALASVLGLLIAAHLQSRSSADSDPVRPCRARILAIPGGRNPVAARARPTTSPQRAAGHGRTGPDRRRGAGRSSSTAIDGRRRGIGRTGMSSGFTTSSSSNAIRPFGL
jgi:hypothetical protein